MTTKASEIEWGRPIVWGVIGCFLFEAYYNALGAWEFAGGWDVASKAAGLAFAGICVAFVGAWAGKQAVPLLRDGGGRAPMAWVMLAASVLTFVLSQWMAHRVMGVTFSDGALRREIRGDDIAIKRAEIERIGITRPVKAIEAQLDLELRRTSKSYPKGDGPEATRLRGELATAQRAETLRREIGEADKSGRVVKAGAENAIAGRLGITAEQNQLVVIVLLTALIGFFGNFGLALIEFTNRSRSPPARDEPSWDPRLLPPVPRRLEPPGGASWRAPPAFDGGATWTVPAGTPGGPGGGSTNIIHVGSAGERRQLPPRVAAGRK